MKQIKPVAHFKETELKLALPTTDPAGLLARLSKTRTLAKRVGSHFDLHNIYYDSPTQSLRKSRIALRLRRVESDAKGAWHWLQTLKIGGQSDSALSQRGEWEVPVNGPQLSLQALRDTPWAEFDPRGEIFKSLKPCFVTRFSRSSWLLRRRDGTQLELSLDVGEIVAGDKTASICELELELLAGPASALFAVAHDLSHTLAVLPLNASKAERAYELAQHEPVLATFARPPALDDDMEISAAAQRVLSEMFGQFTRNLYRLLSTDEPEAVHQARIGWRRFKSSLRLFKPVLNHQAQPSWQPLLSVLTRLGDLRNMDVARLETLPALADLYMADDPQRQLHWQAMKQALAQAAQGKLADLRTALQAPATGACLLLLSQWLENLSSSKKSNRKVSELPETLTHFARRRTGRLHRQLEHICELEGLKNSHQIRLLAKRLRYNVESLRKLLPKNRRLAEHQQALQLQENMGAQRDLDQSIQLIVQLDAAPEMLAFIQGYALGKAQHSSSTDKISPRE